MLWNLEHQKLLKKHSTKYHEEYRSFLLCLMMDWTGFVLFTFLRAWYAYTQQIIGENQSLTNQSLRDLAQQWHLESWANHPLFLPASERHRKISNSREHAEWGASWARWLHQWCSWQACWRAPHYSGGHHWAQLTTVPAGIEGVGWNCSLTAVQDWSQCKLSHGNLFLGYLRATIFLGHHKHQKLVI